jgi:hypothetical protein
MNYSIVSHDAVTAKVRPILQGHGIVYYPRDLNVIQNGNRTEAVFKVRFENIDDRTDFIDVDTMGYGVDPQDKGPGKAISYGVKYALLKVLGLETGDDPEEVQDERAVHRPATGEVPAGTRHPGENFDAREKLEGPYSSGSALRGAIKTFASQLAQMKDLGEFTAWMGSTDVVELEKQALRYLPGWWDTGEGCAKDFEPMTSRIHRKLKELEELENIHGNVRTPIDAG